MDRYLFVLSRSTVVLFIIFVFIVIPTCLFALPNGVFELETEVFIKDWLICGPFPGDSDAGVGIETDFLTEHGGETGIVPTVSMQHSSASVPAGSVSWKYVKADDTGKLDFTQHLEPNQRHVAYASAVIHCTKETYALLKTGSNDGLKIWFNGQPVYNSPAPRSTGPDEDHIPVVLKKGDNLLLVKVDQVGGRWWLYGRFEEMRSVGNRLFFTEPLVASVPQSESQTTVIDVFSVLATNPTNNPVGPVYFDVMAGKGRIANRVNCGTVEPGESKWLIAESEADVSDGGKFIDAEIQISSGKDKTSVRVKRQRPNPPQYPDLQVYIVPHSHADLSWPHTPEVSTNLNVQAVSESINILKALPEFKFSEEDVFVFEEFLRRNPDRLEEVRDLLNKNILECGGFYFGPSELLLGGEGLVRNIYYGKHWLLDTFGIDTDFAWNLDEPGHTLQMPQILTKAGIDKFVIWKVLLRPENNLNVTGYVGPNIFRWQSPDGSDVLVTHCPEEYGIGKMLRTDSFFSASKQFSDFVQREIKHNNEWDLPPVIMMADGSDCTIPDPRVGQNARLWNQMYRFPNVKIGSVAQYFDAVENAVEQGKGTIQTINGEFPCWWAGTQSVENDAFMLSRRAEAIVTAAEKFSTVNDLLFPDYEYPQYAIENVWKGKLWVHEHNWGGTDGDISDAIKLARSRETYRLADDLHKNTLGTLVSNIRYKDLGIPLVIFNSLTWDRTDIVDEIVAVDEKGITELCLLDGSGKEVPVQTNVLAENKDGSIARAQVVFEASVPSMGYATYYLAPGANHSRSELIANETILENGYFQVSIDPESGGISSIYDKQNETEILDTSVYKGNELIALENFGVDEGEEFSDNWWRMSEDPVTVTLVESGPIRATLRIAGKILNSSWEQDISLYAGLPKIDIKTILDWDGQKEIQINSTFPFSLENPRLTYEVPFSQVEYGDESPAAMASHPTVRATNNWINLSNTDMGITLATEVTPFDCKDRRDPRFHDARVIKGEWEKSRFSIYNGEDYTVHKRIALQDPVLLETDFVIQPILLRSVFSCGDPNLFFTQEGKHDYRFAITTHNGSLISHDAVRFGWEHNTPFWVERGKASAGNLSDSDTFINISSPNVLVSIIKKAEDGNGYVLRCYETDGKDTNVTLTFNTLLKSAEHTNIIEQHGEPVRIKDGKLDFHIGHHAIETFRLFF